jgi:peptidoglycan/LPS O-acetylase OafA/YrhL
MKGRFYRPELDVLRCLAFAMVFLRHTGAFITGRGICGRCVGRGILGRGPVFSALGLSDH